MLPADDCTRAGGCFAETGYPLSMEILTAQLDPVRAVSGSWQQQMKWAIRDSQTLRRAVGLPESKENQPKAASQFPVFAPLPFVSRIKTGDIDDPLLKQILPVADEDTVLPGFQSDPLEEAEATLSPGLLQKYRNRVLLVSTGACAIHCRYCFRREFPYSQSPTSPKQWEPAIEKIQADTNIDEVILSGGDPLTIVDDNLIGLIDQLEAISHVKRLRFHTRLPIMIPQRVTVRLTERLQRFKGQVLMVIHCNHANEIDDRVAVAIAGLKRAGVTLLNQSVLLKGINDDADALVGLSNRLLETGVLPYYLHQLDRVNGAGHFEVPRERGVQLIAEMRTRLSGYGVPRYVKEEPGEPNKTVWA